jgi:hypothetical protein
VGTQGRLATLPNAMSKHAVFGLTRQQAKDTIVRIAEVVRECKNYFEQAVGHSHDFDAIASSFRNPRDVGWTLSEAPTLGAICRMSNEALANVDRVSCSVSHGRIGETVEV